MRKNYALLKRYVLALTLFTATTVVIYSCKKELYVSEKPNPAIPAQTMTKDQIASAMAPYKYTGMGSKGTPNCPK